jgi:Holliday junction resolvase RusA-like endonuclease
MIDLKPRCIQKIIFEVPGQPQQKRSASNMRFKRKDGSEIWRPVKNKENISVEAKVQHYAKEARRALGISSEPFCGPVILQARFYFDIRKGDANSWRGELYRTGEILHTSMPDLDRLLNMAQDSLTSIIWKDDSQVCGYGNSGKFYSPIPRTEIMICLLANQIPASQAEYKKMMEV